MAIILLERTLTCHLAELKGVGMVVRNFCFIGMLVSFTVTGPVTPQAGELLIALQPAREQGTE